MKRVYRSKMDKKIFGVCGGIGEAYDIDPTLIRIIVVFLALSTGLLPMLVTYIVARFLMPPADQ
ncbi:MAG: PspC domain-containing protein [Planctomycetes bacterium]|nr:PspC domain-containing protein [Planctomycetota bacterium]